MSGNSCGKRLTYHLCDIPSDMYCVKIMHGGSTGEFTHHDIPEDMWHGSNGDFLSANFSRDIPDKCSLYSNEEFLRNHFTDALPHGSNGQFYPMICQCVQMGNFHDVIFPMISHIVQMGNFYVGNCHVLFPTKCQFVQMWKFHIVILPMICCIV